MSTASAAKPNPATALTPDTNYPARAPAPIATARPAAAGQAGLTAAELELFYIKGWVLKKGLFDQARIAALAAEVDGLHEHMATPGIEADYQQRFPHFCSVGAAWEEHLDATKPKRIRQLMGSQIVSPVIDRMSRSEEILAVMRQVVGEHVYLYHSKLMMKAAHDGSFTPWHQDYQYWQFETRTPSQVNCMLFIDGSDEDNGCLRMVDGSHQLGLLPIHNLKSSSFNIGLAGSLSDYPSTSIPTEPGDAIFFGSYVIHGSGPNHSARHRRANTFAFDRAGNFGKRGDEPKGLPLSYHRCGAVDPLSR